MTILSSADPHAPEKANQHITTFIEKHRDKILPLPFFSNKVNTKTFFSPIADYFSNGQLQHLKEYHFFGSILTLRNIQITERNGLNQEIKSVQLAYDISLEHLRHYESVRKAFERLMIGEIMDISLIKPLLKEDLSSEVRINNFLYKKALRNDPLLTMYNEVHFQYWAQKNYKKILN